MTDTSKFNICLKNVADVRALVYSSTDFGIRGYIAGQNKTVSANSILGLFTLDLSKPHVLEVSRNDSEKVDGFIKALREKDISVEPVLA